MNRTLANLETRRQANAQQFVREVQAAVDADFDNTTEVIAAADLDEKGIPKGKAGEIIVGRVGRDGKWYRVKADVLLAILDRLPPTPPGLRVVEADSDENAP